MPKNIPVINIGGTNYDVKDAQARDDTLRIAEALYKSAGLILLSGFSKTQHEDSGVTFDWDGDACHIHGTSTAVAVCTLYDSYDFDVFQRGKTYKLQMDGTAYIDLQVICYPAGTIIMTPNDGEFTVPSNATEIIIRLRVSSGKTVDNVVHPYIRIGDKTPNEYASEIETELANELKLATIRDVYPYSSNSITYTKSGSTISMTFPRMLVHYAQNDGKLKEIMMDAPGTISVPHDSFAVVNIDTRTVESKTLSELKNRAGTNTALLFYNSSGTPRGLIEKYIFSERYSEMADVGFYGTGRNPTFVIQDNYSIVVTIPSNARLNFYNAADNKFVTGSTQVDTTGGTFTVPHDKALIFDRGSQEFSVVDATSDYSPKKMVLFYNSHGSVIGPWYKFYLRQLLYEVIDGRDMKGYPSYYESQMTENVEKINTRLSTAGTSGIVFITDHHYPSNYLNSPALVGTVCHRTGINKVFCGGDYINSEETKAAALRRINQTGSKYQYAGVKTFRLVGNHEFNNPGGSSDPSYTAKQLTDVELRHAIMNTFIDDVVADPNTLSYYYDDTLNKIRYIVGAVTYVSTLNPNSVKWMCDQLLAVPNDYSAVVLCHTISDKINGPIASATNLVKVAEAMKNHTSYAFDGKTYDFTSKQSEFICMICGDRHVDFDYITTGGVKIIATTTDSMQEEGSLVRTRGTITEQAFDVFVFDTTNKTISVIRYGAGEDRNYLY